MQWEEKCKFAVSLIGLKVIAVFVVIFMMFEGLSVTVQAQDEIFSEGIYRTLFNDSGESGYASTIGGTGNTQTSESDSAMTILGTIAIQNEKNVYYNRSTDPEFDDEEDAE